MKINIFIGAILAVILVACTPQPSTITGQQQSGLESTTTEKFTDAAQTIDISEIQAIAGQTVYIPVYSHIYFRNTQQAYNLASTLSIRNTDPNSPIIITSVSYYNTDGNLVKNYLDSALKMPPLASMEFFIEQSNTSGGSGANFLVEWVSESAVSEPIMESVMIGVSGTQGLAFTSRGQVINNQP
ncbi:MAG: DUF3124 domain-containing protein [Limnospira sp. PMC 1291.21]|uniref:DUF3124 domain-containing protein n=3 Tax=Limnospira TaxID=2596745 RepID=A0A9P1KAE7_9CYAN|nr:MULTISPECIES: DUF3124 domain-containing protein [Limnospira]EKD10194.1 hypothetical protein SPLC1_S102240 [Arthrospira platensis C1]MBD2667899.1 DUF3124 domain-containing protein [Arthrospira platensis FACHB-439]MDC0836255.1 DUF3124 domain-containing protein [Limnoraphis robusta]MDT9181309.1 DUF3124 domain-containing protein [Limnospira sp. PMC 289.06]MDY7053074.1 DUF3124 domain-containing protein [Limnospira fusiformis LS22]QJB28615.1 DUF3124 domain-containing protein [Limnospira fusiform